VRRRTVFVLSALPAAVIAVLRAGTVIMGGHRWRVGVMIVVSAVPPPVLVARLCARSLIRGWCGDRRFGTAARVWGRFYVSR
jgi:hypothetical protein